LCNARNYADIGAQVCYNVCDTARGCIHFNRMRGRNMSQKGFASDTSKRTPKQWAQGLTALVAGLTIAHLGVSLFLVSELGSDTFTLLIQGISRVCGLTIGTCHVIALILLMGIMLLTTKGYVKPGTFICAFCGGWIIDLFLWIIGDSVSAASPMAVRVISMLAGCVILSLGMSMVIRSNSGTGPNDLIAIILTDKLNSRFKIGFRWVRIACDVIFTVAGILLGGTFGIGTIAAAVIIGPLVQMFLPVSEKIIKSVFPGLLEADGEIKAK